MKAKTPEWCTMCSDYDTNCPHCNPNLTFIPNPNEVRCTNCDTFYDSKQEQKCPVCGKK